METIKELEKNVVLDQIEMLLSLAEYRERTFEIKKLEQIKEYILKH